MARLELGNKGGKVTPRGNSISQPCKPCTRCWMRGKWVPAIQGGASLTEFLLLKLQDFRRENSEPGARGVFSWKNSSLYMPAGHLI